MGFTQNMGNCYYAAGYGRSIDSLHAHSHPISIEVCSFVEPKLGSATPDSDKQKIEPDPCRSESGSTTLEICEQML
jgi:hypothetical protein